MKKLSLYELTKQLATALSAVLELLVLISPFTWLPKIPRLVQALRQRHGEPAQAATVAVCASLRLDADEFSFHNGGYLIRSILGGTVADGSLDEQSCEKLDLQLVWTEHRDQEHQEFARRAVAELMLAWLWLRCSDAMSEGFYRDKARGVCSDHIKTAERLTSIGSKATAEAIEDFARRTSGSMISAEAWNVLARANHDKARVAGGFHVCLGNVRRPLMRIGGFTLSASTPVWFNGPQSDAERVQQAHFARLADEAHTRGREEKARQAKAA